MRNEAYFCVRLSDVGWVQHSGTHQLFFDDCWWVSPTLPARIDYDTDSEPDCRTTKAELPPGMTARSGPENIFALRASKCYVNFFYETAALDRTRHNHHD
jgi:hypothetical protein